MASPHPSSVDQQRRAEVEALGRPDLIAGRVARTDRGVVTVWPDRERLDIAKLRATCATDGKDVVAGDWVALDPANHRVEQRLERHTEFVRRSAKGALTAQTLAANMDVVFCIQAMVPGINPRRLEREMVLAHQSGAKVAVVLTKADLVDDADAQRTIAERSAPGVPVHLVSSTEGTGLDALRASLPVGCTVSMFGASGVGKSTLVNAWAGGPVQLIGEVRAGDSKGRHTTSAARLIRLADDLVLLDTPGTRALALWEADDGLTATFPEILEASENCRFDDCRHTDEPGCGVIGVVDRDRLESFRRLRDELDELDEKLDDKFRRPH